MILRIVSTFVLIGLVMSAYILFARPYQLRWGASDEEVARPMPGDELDPNAHFPHSLEPSLGAAVSVTFGFVFRIHRPHGRPEDPGWDQRQGRRTSRAGDKYQP